MKWSSFTILYVPLGIWVRYISYAMLGLGTIMVTLTIFSHFSPSPEKSLYERVLEDREAYIKVHEKLATSVHPEDRAQAAFEKKMLCAISGTFCHADVRRIDDADMAGSFTGKVLSLYTFPLQNMPASGMQSVQSVIARAGLVPDAVAADGSGFGGLAPYSFIWEQMRNVTYIILVLVILFSGFFIMFRSSVNAGVAVSVENLLPKVVLTMVLIQLSFAISGFLIDVMYIASAFVVSLFAPLVLPDLSMVEAINQYVFSTPFGILRGLIGPEDFFGSMWTILYTIPDALMSIMGWQIRTLFVVLMMFIANTVVKPALEPQSGSFMSLFSSLAANVKNLLEIIIGVGSGNAPVAISGAVKLVWGQLKEFLGNYWLVILFAFFPQIVIGFLLFMSVIVAAIKILKMMFWAYISIILYTVFAPFILLLDLYPGKTGFKAWVKSLLSELAVFPLFIAVSLFSFLILGFETAGVGLRLPYLIGIEPQAFSYLIGMSILVMSPGFIDKFRKEMFGSGMNLAGDAQKALIQGMELISNPPRILSRIPLVGTASSQIKKGYESAGNFLQNKQTPTARQALIDMASVIRNMRRGGQQS